MTAQPTLCSNQDHSRPVSAVARITWPDGRFKRVHACVGCLNWLVKRQRTDADSRRPMLIEPIGSTP